MALALQDMTLSEAVVVGESCLHSVELAVAGICGSLLRGTCSLGVLGLCTLLLGSGGGKHLAVLLSLGSSSLCSHLGITELGLKGSALSDRCTLDLTSLGSVAGSMALLGECFGGLALLAATHCDGLGLEDLRLGQHRVHIVAVCEGKILLAQVLSHEERWGRCEVEGRTAVTDRRLTKLGGGDSGWCGHALH